MVDVEGVIIQSCWRADFCIWIKIVFMNKDTINLKMNFFYFIKKQKDFLNKLIIRKEYK